MSQISLRRNILIYNAYDQGLPAFVVARKFMCSEEDVFAAIVYHAVTVDKVYLRGLLRKQELRVLVESGFPVSRLASYYEMPVEWFLSLLYQDCLNADDVKARLLFERGYFVPRPKLRVLAARFRVPFGTARKWVNEEKYLRRAS